MKKIFLLLLLMGIFFWISSSLLAGQQQSRGESIMLFPKIIKTTIIQAGQAWINRSILRKISNFLASLKEIGEKIIEERMVIIKEEFEEEKEEMKEDLIRLKNFLWQKIWQ